MIEIDLTKPELLAIYASMATRYDQSDVTPGADFLSAMDKIKDALTE